MFGASPWAGPFFISSKQYEKRLKELTELNEEYVQKKTKAETSTHISAKDN